MKLIIARHGETEGNTGLFHQYPETPLTETGRAQARALALTLADYDLDAAYASDYARVAQTAEEVLKYHDGIPVVFSPELRERNVGIFTGRPHGELSAAREAAGVPFYEYRPEGGESFLEFQKKVVGFYENILGRHEEGTIIWLTHHGVIMSLFLHLMHKPWEAHKDFIIPNTAFSVLAVGADRIPEFQILNSTAHLESLTGLTQ